MALELTQLREARLYRRLEDRRVLCQLCPHFCRIDEGMKGICYVRENRAGVLYTTSFGRLTSRNVDSVEKKPLYHFYPGSRALSISAPGCNLHCQYCVNWAISQMPNEYAAGPTVSPEDIVREALQSNCQSIAYTYTEPTIFFEYVEEVSRLARTSGLLNIHKTNGFMSTEMLEAAAQYMDAANVDLKAFKETTYQHLGGKLQPVLQALRLLSSSNVWLELSTVIIPDLNDTDEELTDIARFIKHDLGVDTPWHLARFFPAYEMSHLSPTPIETLERARQIGLAEGLRYVYLSNVPLPHKQNTSCGNCAYTIIQRHGFKLMSNHIKDGCCPNCQTRVPGVRMSAETAD
ncbi:MAG TPA: AmmeMemoRadiSam system radical SAM enzyme [Pyrinomonadaceae bacterium]|nr:AmmeMemoRadiSam system radical SAM enzyme [Pyrinomonadaceae bacterium]